MSDFEKIKKNNEGEEITLDANNAQESTENKIEEPVKKYTHSINGVMVSDEEYEDYISRGADASK